MLNAEFHKHKFESRRRHLKIFSVSNTSKVECKMIFDQNSRPIRLKSADGFLKCKICKEIQFAVVVHPSWIRVSLDIGKKLINSKFSKTGNFIRLQIQIMG